MIDFYIKKDDGLIEHYRLCKVCDKNMIQIAGTEFFLQYVGNTSDKDPNIPIISKPNTKWFYVNGNVCLSWSGAYYVSIPNNYVFQCE